MINLNLKLVKVNQGTLCADAQGSFIGSREVSLRCQELLGVVLIVRKGHLNSLNKKDYINYLFIYANLYIIK